MAKVFELKKQRVALIAKARAEHERLSTAAVEDGREFRALSAEDKANVDKIMADVTSLDELIDSLEALEGVAGAATDPKAAVMNAEGCGDMVKNSRGRKTDPLSFGEVAELDSVERARQIYGSKEYRKAFNGFVKHGQLILPAEFRDMTLATNTSGGYLVTPTQISDDVTMALNNMVFIRALATIETVETAASLGVRQMSTQPSDAAWTSEIGAITADSTMAFARRDLTPQLLSKQINLSIRLLQASSDAEPIVKERLAYKYAVTEENAFLNGTGSGQPLGLFTASANGVPTSQDYVVTNASSTILDADKLQSVKYQMKQQYIADKSIRWIFHRVFINQLRLLKDTTNRYLWQDNTSAYFGSTAAAAPTTFDGIPVCISEYAPSAATTGAYCGMLAVLKYYRIAQVRDMQIQRLVELLAGTSEVGFLARRWLDGSPVLAEAFVRLKIS